MHITSTARVNLLELKLSGRMDAVWSEHVTHALAENVRAGQHIIRLEMSELAYLSSAGIRVLVIYARQLEAIKGRLTIANPSPYVRGVRESAGLEGMFETGDTTQTT